MTLKPDLRGKREQADSYQLTDLVSLDKLQKIQDAFAEANEVASTITDIYGVPITRTSNHSKVCTIIRASEKGMENCRISGEHLGLEAAKRKGPHHQMCLSLGFTDAAAPIIVNGKHIGNWLIGQYHVRDVDTKRIRQYSREIGVSEEEMVKAFDEMPKLTTERFEKILHFLSLMANEISLMGYNQLLLLRQSEELLHTQKRLEDHQKNLEHKVQERTCELEREVLRTKRVKQDQSRLLTAIEHVDEGIVITDAEGLILYINPAMEKLTGYSANDLLGKNPNILQSGYHDLEFYQEFWKTLMKGKTWNGRFKNKRKDGTIYQEETNVSSVKDNNGSIINYIAVKRDITKDLEIEQQLQQMGKLEAIGTLAAGVAHEINTPVQYVTDNTNFISEAIQDIIQLQSFHRQLTNLVKEANMFEKERNKIVDFAEEIDLEFLEEEIGKAVEASLDGLERISTIVKAMKDFSHPGSQEKSPENINDLIKNTVEVSRNEWKYCADIELALDDSLPPVPLLGNQFKQVLLNMIINAAQSISEKQEKSSTGKGCIEISSSHRDGEACISIKDDGNGIPRKIIDKVFDPFFTTKTVGKGTGQGLSLAFTTIVDGHGGTISVDSDEGTGSTFIITLPLQSSSS